MCCPECYKMVFWSKDDLNFSSSLKKNPQLRWDLFWSSHQPTVFGVTFRPCGKQDKQMGHSIASKPLALADLSLALPHLKERPRWRPCWRTNRADRAEGHVPPSRWSRVDDRFQPCSLCAHVAALPPVIGGPSDHSGLDSAEGVSSVGVGGAGRGAFRGQV